MKDFFIKSFEILVALFAVLLCLSVVIWAGITMFVPGAGVLTGGGFLAGLAILIGGGLYTILVCGMMYLILGIQQNTKRTAEAVEKLLEK